MLKPEKKDPHDKLGTWKALVPISRELVYEECVVGEGSDRQPVGAVQEQVPSELAEKFTAILSPLESHFKAWMQSEVVTPEQQELLAPVHKQLGSIMQGSDAVHLVRYLIGKKDVCFPGALFDGSHYGSKSDALPGASSKPGFFSVLGIFQTSAASAYGQFICQDDVSNQDRQRVIKMLGGKPLLRIFASSLEARFKRDNLAAEIHAMSLASIDPSEDWVTWEVAAVSSLRIARTAEADVRDQIQKGFYKAIGHGDSVAEFILAQFNDSSLAMSPLGPEHEILVKSVASFDSESESRFLLALRLACDRNIRMVDREMLIDKMKGTLGRLPALCAFMEGVRSAKTEKEQLVLIKYAQAVRGFASGYWGSGVMPVFERALRVVRRSGQTIQEEHRFAPNVPAGTFVFLYAFCDGDKQLLSHADQAYQIASQESPGYPNLLHLRSELHRALVRAALVPSLAHSVLLEEWRKIPFGGMESWFRRTIHHCNYLCSLRHPDYPSKTMRLLAYTGSPQLWISMNLGDSPLDISESKLQSLDHYNRTGLKNAVVKDTDIVAELFKRYQLPETIWRGVLASWNDVDPFIYMLQPFAAYNDPQEMLSLAQSLGDMMPHLDPPDYRQFYKWRYDRGNSFVNNQIGFLNEEQREVWTKDTLSHLAEIGSKEAKFAVLVTSHPEVLARIGKYPVGCESCSAYDAEWRTARGLLSYIGDAHIRVAIAFNLSHIRKFNNEVADLFLKASQQYEKSDSHFMNVFNGKIRELLELSCARTIIKLAQDLDMKPVVALQPTFRAGKPGHKFEMPTQVIRKSIEATVATPMRARLAVRCLRSETTDSIQIMRVKMPQSRSPFGQLENMDYRAWLAQNRSAYHMALQVLQD